MSSKPIGPYVPPTWVPEGTRMTLVFRDGRWHPIAYSITRPDDADPPDED